MAATKRPAEVTVFSPLLAPTSHQLAGDLVTIGRASDCTIPVKDRYLSRKHAELLTIDGKWTLRDCGSANGTYLNGNRVSADSPLKSGDRIRLGDTELLFQSEYSTDRFIAISDSRLTPTISIPIQEIIDSRQEQLTGKSLDRFRILNALAMELIEDRPLDQLFGFIVDRIMDHLQPSRTAIGLLTENGKSLASIELRRQNKNDLSELHISQTLLNEVVQEKKALAFVDIGVDDKLSRVQSIIMQGIHSVVCAPLLIQGVVAGVLYVDYYFTQKSLSEEDVRLVGQIARFAAAKLENTRLREEALQKRLMDEELNTAYVIQRRLLPAAAPEIAGYTFAGVNKPCRTVSGDYYDFVVRPNGTVYFVIADVSGKGVTAALLMAGLQAAFRIYTKNDPSPAELVTLLNAMLKENLPQSKFVTLFAGRVHASTGHIEFCNAGHTPPLYITAKGVEELTETDLLLGMFPRAQYRNQILEMGAGDSLVLFTDGVTEAESSDGVEFGSPKIAAAIRNRHGSTASDVAEGLQNAIFTHTTDHSLEDDLTLVVVSRNAGWDRE
ncbi:MAG TPA: SpoIIE family protein phosphatase [Thermoanaerobaculia bacterium]|nr:SpoIIE family protein phosphatase [Thermoanaerobaculia bacterium]